MIQGQVYHWDLDPDHPLGGKLRLGTAALPRLVREDRLSGRFVDVVARKTTVEGETFVFDPELGASARFGAVNSYYHVDRLAAYVDGLLTELGAPGLPGVRVVVGAHSRGDKPFQGAHYRLPGYGNVRPERKEIRPTGEIHLGPGWQHLRHGALPALAGRPYLHNASHNAGILYHEYGHHVSRHTADFQGNADRPAGLQDNRKTAIDEGTSDYWAATFLGSPHIWSWHRRHDGDRVHRRSLVSAKSIREFEESPTSDPHSNGTIWAAALWDLRSRLGDPRRTDLLVLRTLIRWGRPDAGKAERMAATDSRRGLCLAAGLLLRADAELFRSFDAEEIRRVFAARGIEPVLQPEEELVLTA